MFSKRIALLLLPVALGAGCSEQSIETAAKADARTASALVASQTVTLTVSNHSPRLGDTIDVKAKAPVVADPAMVSQVIDLAFDPHFQLSVAPRIPEGWAATYYAGGTKLEASPANAGEWGTVTRVVASGDYQVDGDSNGNQLIVGTANAKPPTAESFSGGSMGDGWDVFFSPDRSRVYNIHHHDGPATIMCRNAANGSACEGFPFQLMHTDSRATGYYHASTHHIWHSTVDGQGRAGFECVDVSNGMPAYCSTRFVDAGAGPVDEYGWGWVNHDAVTGAKAVGDKLFGLNLTEGSLMCLDMAANGGAGGPCAGQPYAGFGGMSFGNVSLQVAGGRVFVMGDGQVKCLDPATGEACADGSWPQYTGRQIPLMAVPSADGVVRNLCAEGDCWSLDGSAHTLPPAFIDYVNANGSGGFGAYYNKADQGGSRLFWGTGNTTIGCFDMATEAACPNFPIYVQSLYSPTVDPSNPNCLWSNGDDGIIRTWDIPSGTMGCKAPPPSSVFKPAVAVPRLACDGSTRIGSWESFTLTSPAATGYVSAKLTVKDSSGTPISGWTDKPLTTGQAIDLSGLSLATTGLTPEFEIHYVDLTDTGAPTASFRVVGQSPEVCFTATARSACPSTGLLPASLPATSAAQLSASGSIKLGDGASKDFAGSSVDVTAQNETNPATCGGELNGSLLGPAFAPVASAKVELLDPAGAPILDASAAPVQVSSDASGHYTFPPLLVGSYRVRISGTPGFAVSSATVVAGGTGTASASNGQVVSPIATVPSASAATVNAEFTENDTDTDADGILDSVEKGSDPSNPVDTDRDGTPDFQDSDSDGDGTPDATEAGGDPTQPRDTDGDRTPDFQDSDSDNDGTPDAQDAFPLNPGESKDSDGDGTGDDADSDDDNDGTPDTKDAFPLDPAESTDTDGDGQGNNADTDDDNDGTPDTQDAFPLDSHESVDTDGDGTGNNADSDDDNDGTPDSQDAFPLNAAETTDTDGDGTGNNADTDDDNDGTPDSQDAFPLNPAESTDTDGDGTGNNADQDDDNDGTPDAQDAFPLDSHESTDTDGDGTGNDADHDDDNDGTPDTQDAFPLNPAETTDTDGDGQGNNADTDDDGDETPDSRDAFPLDSHESTDTDGDGIGDNADTDDDNDGVPDAQDAFPLDKNETTDTDGDGQGNNADSDDDNDGTPDAQDVFPLDSRESVDTDGDGQGNNADSDDDNDGVPDAQDAFPLDSHESVDTDHDGTGNNADTDDDNDGTPDAQDAFPLNAAESTDTDGDGTGNNADTDDDGDGTPDAQDAFPLNPAETTDTDGDGQGNNADTDDDNDGTPDSQDAFPLNPAESTDTDGDGQGNNADTDDDNDGTPDSEDAFPLNPAESTDTDGDGTGNNADTDDDNDGTPDAQDAFPLNPAESTDTDGDGTGNNADQDDDGDSTPDAQDAFPLDSHESVDTDGDGTGNNADQDDDNDGTPDTRDAFPLNPAETTDTDGDGQGDNASTDDDGDGILDAQDAFPLDAHESVDTDRDGRGNNADTDDDNDGHLDSDDTYPLDASEFEDANHDGKPDAAQHEEAKGFTAGGMGGMGCSSSGLGTGRLDVMLVLAVLAGLLLRRKAQRPTASRVLPTAAALATALVGGVAGAQSAPSDVSQAIDAQHFHAAPGVHDMLGLQSAQVAEHGQWSGALSLSYSHRPLVFRQIDGEVVYALVKDQLTAELGGSVGVWGRFELGASLPITGQSSEPAFAIDPSLGKGVGGTGVGDLRLLPKAQLWSSSAGSLALAVPVVLPTASGSSFRGGGGLAVQPQLLAERMLGAVRVLGNAGVSLRRTETLRNLAVGPELRFGAGAELPFSVGGQSLTGQAMLWGAKGLNADAPRMPLEALAALRWQASSSLSLDVGAGRGLTTGHGAPGYRVMTGLRYTPRSAQPAVRMQPVVAAPAPVAPAAPVAVAEPVAPAPAPEPVVVVPAAAEVIAEVKEALLAVQFQPRGAVLSAASAKQLEKVAKVLRQHPDNRFELQGHTDDVGTASSNLKLSQERVDAVRNYLVGTLGVPAEQLTGVGYGETRPIASNGDAAGRALNRRVEFAEVGAP